MICKLRPPRPIDFETIASWITDATACARWAGPRIPFPFFASELPRLLNIDGIESYCLGEETSRVCGFGQFWITSPGAVHLGRIIVSPPERSKGYGRMLCQQLIEIAVHKTGASEMTLRVYRDNSAALSLYVDLGFLTDDSQSTDEVLFMKAAARQITPMPDRA